MIQSARAHFPFVALGIFALLASMWAGLLRLGWQFPHYLLGAFDGTILDLTYTDTAKMYNQPPPTWVAAALVESKKG